MTTHDTTAADPGSPDPEPRGGLPVAALVTAIIAAAIALIALIFVLTDDDDATVETVDTTTTSVATTAAPTTQETTTTAVDTTEPADATTSVTEPTTTSTTTTTVQPDAFASAVWPWSDAATGPGAERYTDPVDAAVGFAESYVGFTDPIVGPFLQGDSRSGEIEIRPVPDGPITTVFVRQLGPDDTWWVLGSATDDIVVDEPSALDVIDNELVVEGKARSFEGVIEVQLRSDGISEPVLTETVTASGGEDLDDFSERFPIESDTTGAGAVVFLSRSGQDGSVWQAGVVRVSFD